MKSRVMLLVAGLSLCSFTALAAAKLKPFQKEAQKKFDEEVAAPLAAANTACGSKLTVKTNFDAYKEDEWSGQSISARCESVLNAVAAVCAKEAYKEELVANIKEVQCLFGGKPGDNNEKTKVNMSVTGKAFVFKMHATNVNLQELAQQVIEKKLNE